MSSLASSSPGTGGQHAGAPAQHGLLANALKAGDVAELAGSQPT